MATIHIVCAQQAARTAEMLQRLLTAEEHHVTQRSGRSALLALETPRAPDEVVVVIWSPEAESQPYVAEWAARTDPDRLIELSVSTPHPPKIHRRAPVIDFTSWRGEQGGRAWNALMERLRAIVRAAENSKSPPLQAAAALAAIGTLIVGGGVVARVEAPPVTAGMALAPEPVLVVSSPTGIGGTGVADLIEPPSAEDLTGGTLPPRVATLQRHHGAPLFVEVEPYQDVELRDPTLIERIRDLIPLRRDNN
jgi:hypothetical protein